MSDEQTPLIVGPDGNPIQPTCCDPMVKVVCAWCGKHMRGDEDNPHVSHSICESCKMKEMGGGG